MTLSNPFGDVVAYRSRTGDYTVPALVCATVDSINPEGVRRGRVPPLTSETHVHLVCFTPGDPRRFVDDQPYDATTPSVTFTRIDPSQPLGERAVGPGTPRDPAHITVASPFGGTYQEWDIPFDPDGAPGTWRWM